MSKMNPEIKTLWIEALRSGDYVQGEGYLKRRANGITRHCCLGVLCDLAVQAGITEHRKYDTELGIIKYGRNLVRSLGSITSPPDEVVEWAGLDSTDGSFDEGDSNLIHLNDSGKSFEYIAQIIEEKF